MVFYSIKYYNRNNILFKTYDINENDIMGLVQQLENTYDHKFLNRTTQILNQDNQLKERSANLNNFNSHVQLFHLFLVKSKKRCFLYQKN